MFQSAFLRISNSLEFTLASSVALRLNLLDEKIKNGGAIFSEKKALSSTKSKKGSKNARALQSLETWRIKISKYLCNA